MDKRQCDIEGCAGAHKSRGWCDTHYQRWRKHGDPLRVLTSGPTPRSREEALFSGIPVGLGAGECWPWQRFLDKDGYGTLKHSGKHYRAHRYSYDLHFPGLEGWMVVRHTCHKESCVNPHHLLAGTQADNIADQAVRGTTTRGERQGLSVLTEDKVREIRRQHLAGETSVAIAKSIGNSVHCVRDVLRGKTWKHVPMPEQAPA